MDVRGFISDKLDIWIICLINLRVQQQQQHTHTHFFFISIKVNLLINGAKAREIIETSFSKRLAYTTFYTRLFVFNTYLW